MRAAAVLAFVVAVLLVALAAPGTPATGDPRETVAPLTETVLLATETAKAALTPSATAYATSAAMLPMVLRSVAATEAPTATPGAACDPSYPAVCLPSPPPDLDCSEIPDRNFLVLPPDPHRLDLDGDGIGCEE